ncbi:sensor histidine kinase [Streptomyces sp. NPDC051976]|uniref:sensor histidine kinase n=1 Tax=Streptomyces sp. NPDC051976 TaxID=3154947 RepID=UPI003434DEA4
MDTTPRPTDSAKGRSERPGPPPRELTVGARVAPWVCGAAGLALLALTGRSLLVFRMGRGMVSPPALLLLVIVIVCALRMLRRRPLAALAMMLAAAFAAGCAARTPVIPLLVFLAIDIAITRIAARGSRRTSILAVSMALGVLGAYALAWALFQPQRYDLPVETAIALTAVIAWLVGDSMGQRRAHAQALSAQATVQAVTAERLRIARELHDMVAHSIGIIAIQAGVGSRVIDTQPAEARNALSAIEATSRETLSGLRRMLGALRQADPVADADPEAEATAERGDAAPGLADVERLVARTGDAGVRVEVRWRGDRSPLPPDIDLSAFRIIQEAVTNVVRHAGTPYCQVSVDRGKEELSIEITDDGNGHGESRPVPSPGYGISGMRERVGLLHGEFSAGPRPGGGFRVAARLPVPEGVR